MNEYYFGWIKGHLSKENHAVVWTAQAKEDYWTPLLVPGGWRVFYMEYVPNRKLIEG